VEIVGRGCDGGDEWVGVAGGEEGKVHPCDAGLELTDGSGVCWIVGPGALASCGRGLWALREGGSTVRRWRRRGRGLI
jgi:hypothetical protein